MPQIAVIMSVYNGQQFIAPAVESVLAQTFSDFEFVVVDDGSSDATLETLRRYARQDDRIRLCECPHAGLTPALNHGLSLSRAPLIARMDADDISLPDRLAVQYRYMQTHERCVLLGGAYELIDVRGRLLIKLCPPVDDASLQRHCLEGRCPIIHSAAMYRRDAAMRIGGYDPRYAVAQDLDLWLRLGEVGELASLPDVLVKYRMHAQSLSETRQHEQMVETRSACESAWSRRGTTATYAGGSGWRSIGDAESNYRQVLKYGWWAFRSGERSTARSYAIDAIGMRPMRTEGYRLLYASFKPR